MASEEEITSDSLNVAVTDVPETLIEYVKVKVAEYITQSKDVSAKVHRVKGQSPKLVLTFGEEKGNEERQASLDTNNDLVKTNTILVTNLPPSVDEDVLESFFESTKKQGGGPVKSVKMISDTNIAFVEFCDKSSVDTVLKKRPITFGKTELGISPYNPILRGDETICHVDVKALFMSEEFAEGLLEKQLECYLSYGPELAALLKVGSRVVRGTDWAYGDQDGRAIGTVTDVENDWVRVKWDNGNKHPYRMGKDSCYDLKLEL